MLVRLTIANFQSIGEERSFDMLPNDRLNKLGHHKVNTAGIDVLKLGILYGANAAGKTTLVKALAWLQMLATEDVSPVSMYRSARHRFMEDTIPITIGAEYIVDGVGYLYAVQFNHKYIVAEELYVSGLGIKADELIFSRTSSESGHALEFSPTFYQNSENIVLKKVITQSIVKPDRLLARQLPLLNVPELNDVVDALSWFDEKLHIIGPKQYSLGLAERIATDPSFEAFAKEVLSTYDVGITGLKIETSTLEEFYGKDDVNEIRKTVSELELGKDKYISRRTEAGDEISIVMSKDGPLVKRVILLHGRNAQTKKFNVSEESDGTKRLVDFLPAFYQLTFSDKVFVIDEIEASIHPILIYELISKFSQDTRATGQLIMTTHESNLLDQKLFRRDEIWFVEKDQFGATDLYSLNKFKEHHTIDIRKGYLNGRYGGIPFTGNLVDLNWHGYDTV
jgi:hypothetical protein